MAQTGRLLPLLLDNTLACSTPPLIVISDSLLQPGLLLLRQIIAESLTRQEHVVVIACEQMPTRIIPSHSHSKRVHVLDFTSGTPFVSSPSFDHDQADNRAQGRLKYLEDTIAEALNAIKDVKEPVLVVLDSIALLAEESSHSSIALLRRILTTLTHAPTGSRLATIHHSAFPSSELRPKSAPTSSSAFLSTLLSPSLSQSTLHLTLHPSPLIELLSRDYGLTVPLQPTQSDPIDLRLINFLDSFHSRSWADPFIRPSRSGEEDERIPLDLGGLNQNGVCVCEWSARGVPNVPKLPPGAVINAQRKLDASPKRILHRGLEGLRRTERGLEAVGLPAVLDKRRLAVVNMPANSVSSAQPDAKTVETLLPFNLDLTVSQQAARRGVALPFARQEDKAEYRGGAIDYAPDVGDDFDDDDPDADLEV